MSNYVISLRNWKRILERFEEEVDLGNYKKTDYNEWKIYKKYDDGPVEVMIDGATTCLIFRNYSADKTIHHSFLDYKDGSFGQFFDAVWSYYATLDKYPLSTAMEDFSVNADSVNKALENVREALTNTCGIEFKNNNYIKVKEKNTMKFNFDFGPVDGNKVHLSVYGIAVKNANGTWVSWDAVNKQVMDVDIMNIDCARFIYKMPVALKDVAEGDVIVHNHKPMFVEKINKDGFWCVDVIDGEKKNILPTKSPFHFDFITKVVNLFGNMNLGNTSANADNPFGNMLPLMLMGDGFNNNDMLPLMFMMNQNNAQFNPMMMFFMMDKNRDNSDMLPLMFMMNPNMFNTSTPKVED